MTQPETGYIAVLLKATRCIALGREDCGRPLAAERARQIARAALVSLGEDWRELAKEAPR